MALNISEANALNALLRYAARRERFDGQEVSWYEAVDAARLLLRSSHKTLMAGFDETDAGDLVDGIR